MVIYVDRVINMPIHYTFNILSGKYRTEHTIHYTLHSFVHNAKHSTWNIHLFILDLFIVQSLNWINIFCDFIIYLNIWSHDSSWARHWAAWLAGVNIWPDVWTCNGEVLFWYCRHCQFVSWRQFKPICINL